MRSNKPDNITQQVRRFILSHPSIRDCLSLGLVNHSALARHICDTLKLRSFDAALAATKRFPIKGEFVTTEEKIRSLISSAQLRVTNKIAVVVATASRDLEKVLSLQNTIRKARGRCNVVDGDEVVTLIISQQHLSLARNILKNSIRTVSSDLAQINVIFDEQVEVTPGVVAYFYGILAYHGINVLEEMSCWTDLILVIREEDVVRALAVLDFSKSL